MNIRKATLPLVVTAGLFLLLLFAPFGQLLVHVPLLGTQRPTRLRGEVILLAAVLSADALARMRRRISVSLPRVGGTAFTLVVLAVAGLVVRDETLAMGAILTASRQAVVKSRDGRVIALHDAAIVAPSAILQPPGTGALRVAGEGPNAFSIEYRGTASDGHPAVIVVPEVSTAEASSVLAVSGAERADVGGRLAMRVKAPAATIRIAYSSTWMIVGLWCTVASLIALLGLVVAALADKQRAASHHPAAVSSSQD